MTPSDRVRHDRRRWLRAGLLAPLLPGAALAATPPRPLRLAAAWDVDGRHQVGVLALRAGRLTVEAAIDVPTRAHGLVALPGGAVLAVARRPGDWMLSWQPTARPRVAPSWTWAEPGRVFNGHAALAPDAATLYTTETDTETGAGLVGVRDARTLSKRAEWPTAGIDPHALLVDRADATLWVANGGVPTSPETGRVKRDLHRMDSSLVRLGLDDGALAGLWQLGDRRLSLRHLAQGDAGIGIALQAEHDDAGVRARAPVLAVADGDGLRAVPLPAAQVWAGYGGDIASTGEGFAVSLPRAGLVCGWTPRGGWTRPQVLQEASALARGGSEVLASGRAQVSSWAEDRTDRWPLDAPVRVDNHWVLLDS